MCYTDQYNMHLMCYTDQYNIGHLMCYNTDQYHIGHFLSVPVMDSFKCLPFSIMREWYDNLLWDKVTRFFLTTQVYL